VQQVFDVEKPHGINEAVAAEAVGKWEAFFCFPPFQWPFLPILGVFGFASGLAFLALPRN
jgi:hypothetical protein